MRILLLGKNGQVGWELQRALLPLGELIALDSKSSEYCGDLAQLEGLRQTVRTLKPDVIVNAAAYTAVDKAETDREQARLINAQAVAVLAEEAAAIDALFVHYSTDYVYAGEGKKPWSESDITSPINTYGQTKREGEEAIERCCRRYLIFRTSWVYAAKGNNFARTMLRLAKERAELSIINDQFGAPTGAELIADTTAHAIKYERQQGEVSGIYHLAAAGVTNWHEYATFVFDIAKEQGVELKLQTAHAISTADYPTQAARPLNSRLQLGKIENTFELKMPEWKIGVKRVLTEWACA
ncbi:dTDP-4-dehydrorhamnose reductase [Enterobacterales bacterium CwR94]|nr:dTDP-4-dehydrorhamnose reductase [Enterobacterales bacterium CwR94]